MKNNPRYAHPALSVEIILSSIEGDPVSMIQVLAHYRDYITSLSLQNIYEENNKATVYVDEFMRRRLETKLLEAIIKFEVDC